MKATATIAIGGVTAGGVTALRDVHAHEVGEEPHLEETIGFLASDITAGLLYNLTLAAWKFSTSVLAPMSGPESFDAEAFELINSLRRDQEERSRILGVLQEDSSQITDNHLSEDLSRIIEEILEHGGFSENDNVLHYRMSNTLSMLYHHERILAVSMYGQNDMSDYLSRTTPLLCRFFPFCIVCRGGCN